MKSLLAPAAVLIGLCGSALSISPLAAGEFKASAQMAGADGTPMGLVTLIQMPEAVVIRIEVNGLTPGAHGFHIHETAACNPDFSAAGGHFNPDGRGHGFGGQGPHAGDLPNVVAHADGTALAEILTDRVSLDEAAKASLFDADGSAIVIHAKPDSYGNSAGAGGRIACGIIKRQS